MVRKKLLHILLLISALALASCKGCDPPFGELAGTRWNATNIASGVLIDIEFGPSRTSDVSMTFYLDTIPYSVRGTRIDTVGNRQFSMKGTYTPRELKTDRGDQVFGYEWDACLAHPDGSTHGAFFKYDYETMFLHMDGRSYPMFRVR